MDSSLNTLNEIDEAGIAQAFHCDIEALSKHILVQKRDCKVFCQNIRSIYKNINDLQLTLSCLKFEPDILILTECQLNSIKPIPIFPNLSEFQTTHHVNKNDGVVVYVSNNIAVNVKEIKLTHASALEIKLDNNNIILGVYRSPSNANADMFINSLDTYLESIKSCNCITLAGDININLTPTPSEQAHERSNRQNYTAMLTMHGLMAGHTFPTRLNNCLDHFMIKLNKEKVSAHIAVLNTTVTDHSLLFLNLSKIKLKSKIQKTKTTTDFNMALKSLTDKNIDELLLSNDPDLIAELLIEKISESLREHTFTTPISKSKRSIKPWITPGILKCIRNRNQMQKKLKNDPLNDILKISYKRYRNFCNKLLKKLKRKYDRERLADSTTNSRRLWSNIKNITHMKQSNTDNTKLFEAMPTPTEAVNHVNEYFAEIGKQLAEKILPCTRSDATVDLGTDNAQLTSFGLLDTDLDEVHYLLMNLKSSSAPGWDNIPTSFLKLAKHEILPIIVHLANLCFKKGIFPRVLKKSIITPVYKNGPRDDVSNYRPISVLPALSKILEKLLNKRLIDFLNKYNILSDAQYGFRQGKSTEDAVSAITSLITENLDRGKKCLTVFLDLKKAFDTVSVPILVRKLEYIGIRGTPLELFKSYLTHRTQKVKIGLNTSRDTNITFGVPQGSVLGPTLFLIYINGLCSLEAGGARVFSYADDTALVFTGENWDSVQKNTEIGLSRVDSWLKANLLTLNTQKTIFMCFSVSNRTQPGTNYSVKIHQCHNIQGTNCACPTIEKVEKTKYLGVILDQRLSWHNHLELVSDRLRKLVWVFKVLRHIASANLIKQIYIALAQSVLIYCIPIWGGAAKTKFLDVERSQRALLKTIYFKPYRFSTHELYALSDLLTVRKLYILTSTLRARKTTVFDPSILGRRRKHDCITGVRFRSAFARRQYVARTAFVYNTINKKLAIFQKSHHDCKNILTVWLKTLTYEQTEALLHPDT